MTAPQGKINTHSYVQTFNRATLAMEIIIVLIAGMTAYGLRTAPTTHIWTTAGVVAALCILALGLAKHPIGLGLAAVVQVLLVLSGFFIPTMWFLGAVFAVIWVVGIALGRRIDREKRHYMLTHPQEYPEAHGADPRTGGYPIS